MYLWMTNTQKVARRFQLYEKKYKSEFQLVVKIKNKKLLLQMSLLGQVSEQKTIYNLIEQSIS